MARELSKDKKSSQGLQRSQEDSRRDMWPAAYSPIGMMRRFAHDMDRMFEGSGFPSMRRFSPWGWGTEGRFFPELEILERDGKLIIRADLPGLNKEDVNVDISEHSVTIEGERKYEHEATEEGVYTSERSYGHFRREIPLREGVKTDSAKANFKNGTLESLWMRRGLRKVRDAFKLQKNRLAPKKVRQLRRDELCLLRRATIKRVVRRSALDWNDRRARFYSLLRIMDSYRTEG